MLHLLFILLLGRYILLDVIYYYNKLFLNRKLDKFAGVCF